METTAAMLLIPKSAGVLANHSSAKGRGTKRMSRSRDNTNVTLASGSRRALDDDLYVSAKQSQKVHEPFGGETGKLAPQET